MNDISKIDKNFNVKEADENGIIYYNCLETPFKVYGLMPPTESEPYFKRIPDFVAKATSEGVTNLAKKAAGGRVRFITNSKTVAIRAKMSAISRMPHFTLCGSAGFDMYADNRYYKTFTPPYDMVDGYSSSLSFNDDKVREITINFPLYSRVDSLEIGLDKDAVINAANGYEITPPVVYYGSSITQGGCASRPGTCYQHIITRRLSCDHINLGFSGNARGEDAIANYIAGLEMSAFVYDYDHNAPNPEHLENTHERMFKTIRKAHPDLPVVMVTAPDRTNGRAKQKDIIMQTYLNAKNSGDRNVYFIDGGAMMDIFGDDNGTVDACHPNDLGFACMAKAIGDCLEKILG